MTEVGPPQVERELRRLFWTLMMRGRSAQHVAAHQSKKRIGLGLTILGYLFIGLIPALIAWRLPALSGASMLHAFTLMFASLTLAADAGTVLFQREESDILLHRPVRPEQLLRAKVAVLLRYALVLALALNAAGLIGGIFAEGSNVLFPFVHAVSTTLLMVFSASSIVLVYNLCLRWFGKERFENLLTMLQVLTALLMMMAGQLFPILERFEVSAASDVATGWWLAAPPVWFGAIDALVVGARPIAELWLPAVIGVVATVGTAWLAFVKLGAAYGAGLAQLNEAGGASVDRGSRRLLPHLVRLPPLSWWLRDAVERQAFLLTSAYMLRDRETKLKLYPGIAPMLAMPLIMVFHSLGRERSSSATAYFAAIGVGYVAIVPMLALLLLQRSEHWRASEWFRLAPLLHWTSMFHGARKAVLLWLTMPAMAVVAGVGAWVEGTPMALVRVLPTACLLPIAALLPALNRAWVPLSLPSQDQRDPTSGCLIMGSAIIGSMAVAIVGVLMESFGWFWPYVAGVAVVSFAAQWWLRDLMRENEWKPQLEVREGGAWGSR